MADFLIYETNALPGPHDHYCAVLDAAKLPDPSAMNWKFRDRIPDDGQRRTGFDEVTAKREIGVHGFWQFGGSTNVNLIRP